MLLLKLIVHFFICSGILLDTLQRNDIPLYIYIYVYASINCEYFYR